MSHSSVQSPSALAQGNGAGRIGFTQSGVGAVKRTIAEVLERCFMPEMYGAITSDVTDCSTMIDKAQTAAGTDGVVWFAPRRKYRLSQVALASSREWMLNGAILRSADPNTYMLTANAVTDVYLRGGTLDGRRSAGSGAGAFQIGIWARNATRLVLESLDVLNFAEDGLYYGSTDHTGCIDSRLNNVRVKGCGRNGISLVDARGWFARGLLLESTSDSAGQYSAGPGAGIDMEPDNNGDLVDDVHIVGITTRNNAGNGIAVYGLAAVVLGQMRICIEGHQSRSDSKGLRVARWPARTALGSEFSLRYRGSVWNSSDTEGAIAVEDLGTGSAVDIEASIYSNNTSAVLIKLAQTSTNYTTGTPKVRIRATAHGRADAVFGGGIQIASVMAKHDIVVNVDALTFAGSTNSGLDGDCTGRVHIVTADGDADVFERARPATITLTRTDSENGARVISNTGATGIVLWTLDHSNIDLFQEFEFHVTAAFPVIIVLSDTSKVIRPFGSYQIGCCGLGARLRIRREASGNWSVVQGPRQQQGLWSMIGYDPAYNPASVAVLGSVSGTLAVPGLDRGDQTSVHFSRSLTGMQLTSYGDSANTAGFVFFNPTAAPIDLAAGVLMIRGFKGRQ